jgi:hypothetical protein
MDAKSAIKNLHLDLPAYVFFCVSIMPHKGHLLYLIRTSYTTQNSVCFCRPEVFIANTVYKHAI